MSESKHVWVFLETEDGQLRSVGLDSDVMVTKNVDAC